MRSLSGLSPGLVMGYLNGVKAGAEGTAKPEPESPVEPGQQSPHLDAPSPPPRLGPHLAKGGT